MRFTEWVRSLIKSVFSKSKNQAVLRVLSAAPKAVGADQRLFCFKNGRKTLLLSAGQSPRGLEAGERCALLPTNPIPVTVVSGAATYSLNVATEPDDQLAAALDKHGDISEERLEAFCQNAFDAVLPTLPQPPDPERLRSRVSLELIEVGFRCVGLTVSVAKAEAPPEPAGDEKILAADLAEAEALARSAGVPVTAADVADDLPAGASERERLVRRMKGMAAELDRKFREYREELEDTRSLEARLGLEAKDAPAKPAMEFTPVGVDEVATPFTALVWQRSDIDVKLRRYIAESLDAAAAGLEQYQRQHLIRNLQLGGQAQQRLNEMADCRQRVDSLAVLYHNFGPTRPDRATVRRRVRQIRVAANAVAGVAGAVTFLCRQTPENKIIADALRDVEAATKTLTAALKVAAKNEA